MEGSVEEQTMKCVKLKFRRGESVIAVILPPLLFYLFYFIFHLLSDTCNLYFSCLSHIKSLEQSIKTDC